jgi:hypothetical protein
VVDHEGSRSFKAIAFINSKGNIRLEAKSYSDPRMSTKRKTAFSEANVKLSVEMKPGVSLSRLIGEELWKK